MNYIKFLLTGILFGIVLAKAEVISWFRIYEMFRFDSFHMYGVIGSAVVTGAIVVWLIRRNNLTSVDGTPIIIPDKTRSRIRYIAGGIFFGIGWGLVGACPGPMFILIGYGYITILVVILGAVLGTFTYGVLMNKLPH